MSQKRFNMSRQRQGSNSWLPGPRFKSSPRYVGCQNGIGQLFSGYLNTVRVWGGALSASQVASNYLFGPWTLPEAAETISFAAISNATLNAGVTLIVTNSATDPDQPPLPLTFSILSAPAGAAINAGSGLFIWRPTVAQADTTNLITLLVTNDATPSLAATQSFVATVNPLLSPNLSNVLLSNDRVGFVVNGAAGPDYAIQSSTNPGSTNWPTIFATNSPALPFNWTDTNPASAPAMFYRALLGPRSP